MWGFAIVLILADLLVGRNWWRWIACPLLLLLVVRNIDPGTVARRVHEHSVTTGRVALRYRAGMEDTVEAFRAEFHRSMPLVVTFVFFAVAPSGLLRDRLRRGKTSSSSDAVS